MPSINPSVTVQATNVRAQTYVEETDSAPKAKITHIAADLADSPGKTAGAEEAPTLKATPAEVRKNLKRVLDSLPLDISAILAVVRKNAQEIRKANVLVRDMGLKAQFDELNKSAGDMQTAANFRLAAGLIQSTVQIGMASAQIYSSVQAGKVAAEGIEPQKQAQELHKQAADLNVNATQLESQAQAQSTSLKTPAQLESDAKVMRNDADNIKARAAAKLEEVKGINARADDIRSKWDASSKIVDGLFGLATTGLKFGAEIYDIRSKEHEVKAKQYESESARANDAIQTATEIGRDALQKLESIEQARNQTNRSIQQNMG